MAPSFKTKAADQSTSRFFQLHGEIRNSIYELALVGPKAISMFKVVYHGDHTAECHRYCQDGTYGIQFRNGSICTYTPFEGSLLLTCQQANNEGRVFYREKNTNFRSDLEATFVKEVEMLENVGDCCDWCMDIQEFHVTYYGDFRRISFAVYKLPSLLTLYYGEFPAGGPGEAWIITPFQRRLQGELEEHQRRMDHLRCLHNSG